ncbi:MAG: hypothetical protein U5K37_10085 [Natrialbaceae archaeon]|nr:hypothetical protein [Natrialbaceae archaeon]
MKRHINPSGLVIAGLGFFLTRFTVTLTVYSDPRQFYPAGVVPLALGLGLSAFGIALTIADIDPAVVRRTAIWSCIGAGTMAVLVILTLAGANPDALFIHRSSDRGPTSQTSSSAVVSAEPSPGSTRHGIITSGSNFASRPTGSVS